MVSCNFRVPDREIRERIQGGYMDINEARTSGLLTVYTDTDPELEREVKEYNKKMSVCRKKMKVIGELEIWYLILNPVVVVGLLLIDPYTSNTIQLGNIGPSAVIIAFAAAFFYFTILKKNLVVPTAVSLLLPFLDVKFAILTAADIILAVWYTMALSRLKEIESYPRFLDIMIKYVKFPEKRS